jgi:hypothetical protein
MREVTGSNPDLDYVCTMYQSVNSVGRMNSDQREALRGLQLYYLSIICAGERIKGKR